jgi:hypothetical protein
MPSQTRNSRIESYGAAHATLLRALERFPREMWQFRPAADAWSIHEVLVHIADSEANSYVRCRRLLAEPGSTVLAYNEAKWASDLRYHEQSPDDALELFRWLRRKSFDLIRDLPEEAWSNTVYHSEDGWITLDAWLVTYEGHIPDHIEQMQAIHAAWARRGKPAPS